MHLLPLHWLPFPSKCSFPIITFFTTMVHLLQLMFNIDTLLSTILVYSKCPPFTLRLLFVVCSSRGFDKCIMNVTNITVSHRIVSSVLHLFILPFPPIPNLWSFSVTPVFPYYYIWSQRFHHLFRQASVFSKWRKIIFMQQLFCIDGKCSDWIFLAGRRVFSKDQVAFPTSMHMLTLDMSLVN